MGFSTSDYEVEMSVKEFSEGNTFSLFKIALNSLYNSRELLSDSTFVLNMFRNTSKLEDRKQFLDLLLDINISLDKTYAETNEEEIKKNNDYWKFEFPQSAPLLFYIIPYLNDEESLTKIFKNGMISFISEHPNKKILSENLIIKLFENGFNKSLDAFQDYHDWFIRSNVSFHEVKKYRDDTEEKYLADFLSPFIENNPRLFLSLEKLTYINLIDSAEKWFTNQLDKERKNNIIIQEFFDTVFIKLEPIEKERIIARTLYKTNNLDYTMLALSKIGINNLSDYKPEEHPIWIYSNDHENKTIYRKLLRNNVSLFDYNNNTNQVFLTTMLDGLPRKNNLIETLNEQKIDYKLFLKDLLETKIDKDNKEYTNYAKASASEDTFTLRSLNLTFENLSSYKKKFEKEKFNNLTDKEQLELLNDVMDRTMLSPTYINNNMYYKQHLEKREVVFNSYASTLTHYEIKDELTEKHLELLEKVEPNYCDYRAKYFKIISNIFNIYGAEYITHKSQLYQLYTKMIDYVATDKSLDWNKISHNLEKSSVIATKPRFSEAALELYNYLEKVSLSHNLALSSSTEKKKLKI